jgi:hypothetical protein
MDSQNFSIERIAALVKTFYNKRLPFRIYHGSSNSARTGQMDPMKIVNTSFLTNVISVSKETQTAIVESNVPMDAFVRATLEQITTVLS